MTDIASLGIVVNTKGIKEAKDGLDGLTETGRKSERAAKDLSKTWEQLSFSPKQLFAANRSIGQYKLNLSEAAKASQKVSAASQPFERAVRGAALSTKQLAAATRGLPAQFTDIATSLAAGQNPLQVFLQQGGQIKDVFGGTGNAIRAVGGYVRGLINPFTVAAAVAVGLSVAFIKGSNEAVEFNKALTLTGKVAGITAEQLGEVAQQMDSLYGVTTASASSALATVAGTGRFTAEQLTAVATAAENMRVATGKAVEETVKEFVRLREDPVKAVLALNDTYHFLTQSTYDQIKALQEQGRHVEAATVAINAYAGAINTRVPQVTENLGFLERAWRGIKNAAQEGWDAMLGIGRQASFNDQLRDLDDRRAALNRQVQQIKARPAGDAREDLLRLYTREFRDLESQYKALDAAARKSASGLKKPTGANGEAVVDSQAIRDRQAAQEEFDRIAISNLTARQRLENEIKTIREKGLKAGVGEVEIQKQIAAARARYAESLPKGRKDRTQDQTKSLIESIQQQIALNQEQAKTEDTLTASQRLRVRVLEELEGLGGKVNASRRAEIDALLKELETTDRMVTAKQDEKRLKEDLLRLTNQLTAAEENRRRGNEIELLSLSGIGAEEVRRRERLLDIEREYQDGLKQLRDRGVAENSESYRVQEAELRASRDRMLQTETEFQRKRSELMADWRNGARAAVQDFVDEAANVAGQTYDIFNSVFNGLTQVLTDFFTKGKADWKGFLDNIAAQITAFVIKQQIAKAITKFIPGFGEEGKGEAAAMNQAAGALAASAAPLMTAAAALTSAAAALSAAGLSQAATGGGGQAGGGTGTSGGGWMGFLTSLFSAWGGGRAIGGPVSAGKLYEVGEGGRPEILAMHGRNYLIPGSSGHVKPMAAANDDRQPILNQTFYVQGAPNAQTREQMARSSGRAAARGMTRTGR